MHVQSLVRSVVRYGTRALMLPLMLASVALPAYAGPTIQDESVNPANLPSNVQVDSLLKPIGNVLFFTANDPQHGIELWKSDGTSAGTSLVKDINPGSESAFVPAGYNRSAAASSVTINNTLFFVATDGKTGYEVWKTNGTASGTTLVKDALPGSKPADFDEAPITNSLTNVDGTLYFAAVSSSMSRVFDLWKSDGSSSGTKRVKSIEPSSLKNVNGTLFFNRGYDGEFNTHGYGELWKSNGSNSGTVLVKDLYANSDSGSILGQSVVGKTLFFVSSNALSEPGYLLWKSDGTTKGTVVLKQSGNAITDLASAGKLFFVVHSARDELWISDSSTAGTKQIAQLDSISGVKSINGKIFFTATQNGVTGLWTSDGTTAGTVALKTFAPNGASANFSNVNGTLFFTVAGDGQGVELWKSNGTVAGTVRVKTLLPSGSTADSLSLVPASNLLYFNLNGQLWKSDGTDAGTVKIS